MKPTYTLDYAIRRLRDAIELAELEGNYQSVRLAVNDLVDSIKAEELQVDRDADAKDQENTNRSIISTFYPA